ncbi:MAG: flagellar FlbD family protein [Actinomycetota bacterium]|nr:flagellar FlbD family protein [Actinomycetota bacterium]
MITVHRLNHDLVLVNPDLIARVEACPDTVLHLTNGSSLLVAETPDEVAEGILAWRRQVMQEALAAH